MASLNDIETKIQDIINALSGAAIGTVEIIPITIVSGTWKLSNTTFTDIRSMISNGKMPYLFYIDDNNIIFYIPSLIQPDTDGLLWYNIRYRVSTNDARFVTMHEITSAGDNELGQLTKTITLSD